MSKVKDFFKYIKNGNIEKITSVSIDKYNKGEILRNRKILLHLENYNFSLDLIKACLEEKAVVTIASKNKELIEGIQKTLSHECLYFIVHDIANEKMAWVLIKKASDLMEGIDTLIHGQSSDVSHIDFFNVTDDYYNNLMNLSQRGVFFLTQSFIRFYSKNNMSSGKILFILRNDKSSEEYVLPSSLIDSSNKSLTEGLAKKLILRGIRVNGISLCSPDKSHYKKVANIATFLISDAANSISGVVVPCS